MTVALAPTKLSVFAVDLGAPERLGQADDILAKARMVTSESDQVLVKHRLAGPPAEW